MFKLPELPFAPDSFGDIFSAETFEYHHGKHHQTYVTNLNNLIKGTEFEAMDLESIIKKAQGGLFNNAAQHFNHSFFWNCMSPNGGGTPSGAVLAEIEKVDHKGIAHRDLLVKARVQLRVCGAVTQGQGQ